MQGRRSRQQEGVSEVEEGTKVTGKWDEEGGKGREAGVCTRGEVVSERNLK